MDPSADFPKGGLPIDVRCQVQQREISHYHFPGAIMDASKGCQSIKARAEHAFHAQVTIDLQQLIKHYKCYIIRRCNNFHILTCNKSLIIYSQVHILFS